MKKIAAIFFLSLIVLSPRLGFSLELLSDETMSGISGQADTGFSEDNDKTVYLEFNTPVPYPDGEDEFDRKSFAGDYNGPNHKSILVDFIGKDEVDRFGNTYRAPFYADVHIDTFVYNNEEGQFAIFDGYVNGFVQIPESFGTDSTGNPIYSKEVGLSLSNIPAEFVGQDNYLCSYQGNIFTPGSVTEGGTSFEIYPNRQAQTIGSALDGDLTILIPREQTDGSFEWGVGAVIPEGKRYIHIDLNVMYERRILNMDIQLATYKDEYPYESNELDFGVLPDPEKINVGTLGTAFTDSTMRVMGGSVFITIDEFSNNIQ